jgi:hypothetical protein
MLLLAMALGFTLEVMREGELTLQSILVILLTIGVVAAVIRGMDRWLDPPAREAGRGKQK